MTGLGTTSVRRPLSPLKRPIRRQSAGAESCQKRPHSLRQFSAVCRQRRACSVELQHWWLRRAKLFVPYNTAVAVIKACLYDPQVNRTYTEMAAHYEGAILPAARPTATEPRLGLSEAAWSAKFGYRVGAEVVYGSDCVSHEASPPIFDLVRSGSPEETQVASRSEKVQAEAHLPTARFRRSLNKDNESVKPGDHIPNSSDS